MGRPREHGHAVGGVQTRTYRSWQAMKRRCYSPKEPGYENYGGRGIAVCVRWRSFEHFLEDMGERPEETSIDRLDNMKGYSPGNCQWSTRKEQANNRTNNHIIVFGVHTMNLTQWAKYLGMKFTTIQKRLKRGWTMARIAATPVNSYNGGTK